MSFKIDYELSPTLVRKLENISQTDGYLQVLRMNPDWASLLERKANIIEAVSSIGIEGTVLSISDAKAITVGEDRSNIGEKEKREFQGYYDSLQYIKKNIENELTSGLLLKIHEMITRGDIKANPGKFRNDLRQIESKGKIIYTPPPPEHLNFLLKEFLTWFNTVASDKDFSPVLAGAICHFWFVWIHPFCDGNGRVGRLLTTFLLLKKKSEGVKYFALSDFYNKNKDSYYNALEQTNICQPLIPSMNFNESLNIWVDFFAFSYLEQMKDIKETTNRILQLNIRVQHLTSEGLITENHRKLLSLLSKKERVSYSEIVEHMGGVSKPYVTELLKPLRKAQILVEERIGRLLWFKLGSPEDEPNEAVLIKKKLKRRPVDNKKSLQNKDQKQLILPIFEN
jgi:Fic family protein